MLILTRKSKQSIHIGDNIVLRVLKTARGSVQIGIEAPRDVRILRDDVRNADVFELPAHSLPEGVGCD